MATETTSVIVYNIVNPSDPYTMKSDDEAAAAVACMFLGRGAYALTTEDGRDACPIFILGGDPVAWLKETHGVTIDEVMETRRDKVVAALRSVLIGGFAARREVDETLAMLPEDRRAEWLEKRHDSRRSSMNNIGKAAHALADALAAARPRT